MSEWGGQRSALRWTHPVRLFGGFSDCFGCFSGVLVVFLRCFSGVLVVFQWCFSVSVVGFGVGEKEIIGDGKRICGFVAAVSLIGCVGQNLQLDQGTFVEGKVLARSRFFLGRY